MVITKVLVSSSLILNSEEDWKIINDSYWLTLNVYLNSEEDWKLIFSPLNFLPTNS